MKYFLRGLAYRIGYRMVFAFFGMMFMLFSKIFNGS